MKRIITLFVLTLSITAFAQSPIYQFSFDDTEHMSFVGERAVTIYPASERMKPMLESSLQKKIKAADHLSGIIIRTENPDLAIQDIMNQMSEKTGDKIGRVWSSVLKKASPTRIIMGVNKSATWYLVLSPAPDGDYVLTISYLIEDNQDG